MEDELQVTVPPPVVEKKPPRKRSRPSAASVSGTERRTQLKQEMRELSELYNHLSDDSELAQARKFLGQALERLSSEFLGTFYPKE